MSLIKLTESIEIPFAALQDTLPKYSQATPVVFYHGGCLDGMFAAALVAYGEEHPCIFVPVQYGDRYENWKFLCNHDVYVVDFSFEPDDMLAIFDQCNTLTWYDHHDSAMKKRAQWMDVIANGPRADALATHYSEDNSASGAMLTCEAQAIQDYWITQIIMHIDDRDRWKFIYSSTEEICVALYSICSTAVDALTELEQLSYKAYEEYLTMGGALLRERAKQIAMLLPTAVDCGGVVYCNAPSFLASALGNAIATKHGKAACIYQVTGDGIKLSYRSTDECPVSAQELASTFGGGGHKNAAGAFIKGARGQYAFMHDRISYVKWDEYTTGGA